MARRFVTLLIIVFGIAALWSGGWYLAAWVLRGEIDKAATGSPSIACADLKIGGYPFRFDVTCTGASIIDGDISVSIGEMRATALVYMPNFVELFADGPATYSDAFTGASNRLDWNRMQASVRLDWLSLARASIVADGLVASDTVLDITEMARASHAEFHAVGVDGAVGKDNRNLRFYAKLQDVVTPRLADPLQADVSALLTEWPADVRTWGASDIVRYWASGDGDLRIEKAEMSTGELSGTLSGTLALDAEGLVDGSLSLTSRGVAPLLKDYLAAPLASALLGPEDPSGEAHQTLVFSHSIMRAGIVPLFGFPPLF